MATATAYMQADQDWTLKYGNWHPSLAIDAVVDVADRPNSWPNETISNLCRDLLGSAPDDADQGFLASSATDIDHIVSAPVTGTDTDPTGYLGEQAVRWAEVNYDDATDLVINFDANLYLKDGPTGTNHALESMVLRHATVVAHWTWAGGDTGWLRNPSP